MDATDKNTWTRARINMPHHRFFDAAEFAPRAWAAICELCGGEDRIDTETRQWRDSLIVNLGSAEGEGRTVAPPALENWHVDGDFFVHYLDSPEQALLVIPLFTDVRPGGGGTMICPPAIPEVARWLLDHPEGVSPRMVPRGDPDFVRERNLGWFAKLARKVGELYGTEPAWSGDREKKDAAMPIAEGKGVAQEPRSGFVEVTGSAGDVFLLHPLMMHSATTNSLRDVRIITNPPISLREPFRFYRAGAGDGEYSLVERATLRALGREDLPGWEITAPRERVVPARVKIQQEMKEAELRRLQEAKKLTVAA